MQGCLSFILLSFMIGFTKADEPSFPLSQLVPQDLIKLTADNEGINLKLNDALERGLRKNYQERKRSLDRVTFNLNFNDDFNEFWFPTLAIGLDSNDGYYSSFYQENDRSLLPFTHSGTFFLGFKDYTLYNWGRDYLVYQNKRSEYHRLKERLTEARRALRFNIIRQYFLCSTLKEVVDIKRQQLKHTSFLFRLNTERLNLKKIKKLEFMQTKADYLRAHTEYHEIVQQSHQEQNKLSEFIGESLERNFIYEDKLDFITLKLGQEKAKELALRQSPQIRDARLSLINAKRMYDKANKDSLPLPELKLSLGAYRNEFSNSGQLDRYDTIDRNNNDLDVVASIQFEIPIFGRGGLFGRNNRARAHLDQKRSEIDLDESKRNLTSSIHFYTKQIKSIEDFIEANNKQTSLTRDLFDTSLDYYMKGQTTYPDIRISLDNHINAQERYHNMLFKHLDLKLELAQLIGVDDFPSESFEALITK